MNQLTERRARPAFVLPLHGWSRGAKVASAAAVLASGFLGCPADTPPAEPLRLVKFLPFDFDRPVAMVPVPGNPNRWFVIGQMGGVWAADRGSGTWKRSLLLDISEKVTGPEVYTELGLLGIALHPSWEERPILFLAYTTGEPDDLELVLSRFEFVRDDKGERINRRSEQVLLRVPLPSEYHHGGSLEFGPDGLLYLGIGDGANRDAAQDRSSLLGSILRIDVGPEGPYGIPADNPPADGAERPELFAWGLRNPWKLTFDRETEELWTGDVGQRKVEEVDRVEKGRNYGWPCYEGMERVDVLYPGRTVPESCDHGTFEEPVTTYPHPEGCSVTGGYVYRGTRIPRLVGTYLFGDYCSGKLYGLRVDDTSSWTLRDVPLVGRLLGRKPETRRHETLMETGRLISSFAQDHEGELYLIDLRGYIYALE